MAGVPDTTTFSLHDVVAILLPATNDLQACFNAADDEFFDPAYKGSKDSLYNFRNYGGSSTIWRTYFYGVSSGDIKHNNATWSTVRGAATGTSVNTTNDFECWVDYTGGVYYIRRTLLRFDLTSIPASATCEEAGIGFDTVTEYGSTFWVYGLEGTFATTLTTADYDAFTFSDYIMSSYTAGPTGVWASFDYVIESTGSTQLGKVESAFGDYLYVAIINGYYDNGNNTPSSKQGFDIFRAGEVQTEPTLRVVFTI